MTSEMTTRDKGPWHSAEATWETLPREFGFDEVRACTTDVTHVRASFVLTEPVERLRAFVASVDAVMRWFPLLCTAQQTGPGTYHALFLSPGAVMPQMCDMTFELNETAGRVVMCLDGDVGLEVLLEQREADTTTVTIRCWSASTARQGVVWLVLVRDYLLDALHPSKHWAECVAMERRGTARLVDAPLPVTVHESQRVRITATEEWDEAFLQVDVRVPLSVSAYFRMFDSKDPMFRPLGERTLLLKDGRFLTQHVNFVVGTEIAGSSFKSFAVDINSSRRINERGFFVAIRNADNTGCTRTHSSARLRDGLVMGKVCGDTETRVIYAVRLVFPELRQLPLAQRRAFITGSVGPTLYYFAFMAHPAPCYAPPFASSFPTHLMTNLIHSALLLRAQRPARKTLLVDLPPEILLRVFAQVGVCSIKNVLLLCKAFHQLLCGPQSAPVWAQIHRSACHYPPNRPQPPRTRDDLMRDALVRRHWRKLDPSPITLEFTTPVTAVDVGDALVVGGENGVCVEYALPAVAPRRALKTIPAPVVGLWTAGCDVRVAYANGTLLLPDAVCEAPAFGTVTFLSDRTHCVGYDQRLSLVALETGTASPFQTPPTMHTTACEFGPSLLVGSADCAVRLYDPRTMTYAFSISAHTAPVCGVCVVSDTDVVTCGADRMVVAWDARVGRVLGRDELPSLPVAAAVFNSKVVCPLQNGQVVFLWKNEARIRQRVLFRVSSSPRAVSLSDTMLAVGTHGGQVVLWRVEETVN